MEVSCFCSLVKGGEALGFVNLSKKEFLNMVERIVINIGNSSVVKTELSHVNPIKQCDI